MTIEWLGMLSIIGILFFVLVLIKLIDKKVKFKGETKRKLFHMSMGVVMLSFPYVFANPLSVNILGGFAIMIMIILKNTKLKKSLGSVLYSVDRESLGEFFYIISIMVIFYLSKGDPVLYSIPILILTFADSTAALIGKNYGKENLAQMNEDSKSIEGSFMFFIVAFMATLVPLLLFTTVGRAELLIISIIIGFNVALIEMISHTGNDNLLIPLTTFAFLATHIHKSLGDLELSLLVISILVILVAIANRIKMWSKLALVEVLVVGYLIISLYGWYAVIPPLMLLLTVMRFPKIRENEKSNVYDSRIIETNILIGTAICGFVAITGMEKELFWIYGTCYAMHLIVNTYVRFKFYFEKNVLDCITLSIIKGMFFVTIPVLVLNKLIFNELITINAFIVMIVAMCLSSIAIAIKKCNVKEEEISIDNGLMHMKIVLFFTGVMAAIQYFNLV